MTTERQARSNRQNSRASTGPRTAEGRAKSAGNSRGDGLSTPLTPELLAEARTRAWQIAADAGAPELHDLAWPIAHADVELRRIREVRSRHVTRVLTICTGSTGSGGDTGYASAPTADPSRELQALLATVRYERRARGRRRMAMREFMRELRKRRR